MYTIAQVEKFDQDLFCVTKEGEESHLFSVIDEALAYVKEQYAV